MIIAILLIPVVLLSAYLVDSASDFPRNWWQGPGRVLSSFLLGCLVVIMLFKIMPPWTVKVDTAKAVSIIPANQITMVSGADSNKKTYVLKNGRHIETEMDFSDGGKSVPARATVIKRHSGPWFTSSDTFTRKTMWISVNTPPISNVLQRDR